MVILHLNTSDVFHGDDCMVSNGIICVPEYGCRSSVSYNHLSGNGPQAFLISAFWRCRIYEKKDNCKALQVLSNGRRLNEEKLVVHSAIPSAMYMKHGAEVSEGCTREHPNDIHTQLHSYTTSMEGNLIKSSSIFDTFGIERSNNRIQ